MVERLSSRQHSYVRIRASGLVTSWSRPHAVAWRAAVARWLTIWWPVLCLAREMAKRLPCEQCSAKVSRHRHKEDEQVELGALDEKSFPLREGGRAGHAAAH